MTWVEALAIGVPATVAVTGLVAKYLNDLHLARRKDRLDRVTRQLSDLYGPLLALTSASGRSWRHFRDLNRPGRAYWDQNPAPTAEEGATWRVWMTEVFMPLNRQMRDLVVHQSHLLEESYVPDHLLDLCAHVAAYEAIVARWAVDDFSENKSNLPFPREKVTTYAEESFKLLKQRQADLLA